MMLLHPTDRALLRAAIRDETDDVDNADGAHRRTLDHLATCARCRALVQNDRGIMARACAVPVRADASETLLGRILADRADGGRVILPLADARTINSDTRRYWRSAAALAAAAALVLVTAGNWSRVQRAFRSGDAVPQEGAGVVGANGAAPAKPPSPGGTAEAGGSDSERSMRQLLSPWPTMAYAQSPATARPSPYPPVQSLDVSRLRVGVRNYLRSSANDYHEMLPHTLVSVRTDRTTWKGRPAWRVVSTEPIRTNAEFADTLIVLDSTLAPVVRHTVSGFMSQREDYRDSVVINTFQITLPPELRKRMQSVRGASSQTRRIDSFSTPKRLDRTRPVVSGYDGMRLLLQAARLPADWKASVSVVAKRMDSPNQVDPATGLTYLNLRVAGIDTVQLFNGRVETWRVLMETGPTPEVWHVSRETGETILTEGAWGPNYPDSRNQLMGWHETKRLPPVRRR